MKSKLDLAHEYFLAVVSRPSTTLRIEDLQEIQRKSWVYADSSYAENEKREKIEAEEKRKQMRGLLNSDNTFIEKEGQHFDDVEWQPDWSMAPEWAVAWTMDSDETLWWSYEPWFHNNFWFVDESVIWQCASAPPFNYSGHWRNSLRKRPK